MSRAVFAIEKSSSFQGRTEEWTNVYTLESEASSDSEYATIADALIAAERPVHAASVNFTGYSVYTYEGLNGTLDFGSMLATGDRALTGTAAQLGTPYKELALLVTWPLPKKAFSSIITRRKRSLKKWLHSCTFISAQSTDQSMGVSEISAGLKTILTTYANAVEQPTVGAQLVAPDGTEPNGAPIIHPYVEHRQFHQGPEFKL